MAVNRGEEVRMLQAAGFRLARRGAKSDLYECDGVTVQIGSGGSGSASAMAEIRTAIRKVEKKRDERRDERIAQASRDIGKALDDAEAKGVHFRCPICDKEPVQVGSGKGLLQTWCKDRLDWANHVQVQHPKFYQRWALDPGFWHPLGLEVGGHARLPAPPPKKDRAYWLAQLGEMLEQTQAQGVILSAGEVIQKMTAAGYRTSSGKVLDESRLWPMLDELNATRSLDVPALEILGRPQPQVPEPPQPVVTPEPAPAAPPAAPSAYAGLDLPPGAAELLDGDLDDTKRLQLLRLVAKVPVSVELLLDDPAIPAGKKLEIVRVVLRKNTP